MILQRMPTCVEGSKEFQLSAQWVDAKQSAVPRRFAEDN
jgi:hypothetical protein